MINRLTYFEKRREGWNGIFQPPGAVIIKIILSSCQNIMINEIILGFYRDMRQMPGKCRDERVEPLWTIQHNWSRDCCNNLGLSP
jgi:hypothetical protein